MGTTHSAKNNIVENYKLHRTAAPTIKENFTSSPCRIRGGNCCGAYNNYTCPNGKVCPRDCGGELCYCPPSVVPCTTADCSSHGVPSGNQPNCTCQCDPPYKGANCSQARTRCTSANACNNHGNPGNSYQNDAGSCGTCSCSTGYSGADCSVRSCTATAVANSNKAGAGSITGNAGSTTAVQCNTGYTGGGTWTCGTNGSFSGTACSAKSCTAAAVANSNKSSGGSITGTTGSTTAVQCDAGYTGGGTWTCGTNGSFSGTKCSAKSCTATQVANSNKSSDDSITGTTGSTTAVQCNTGYTGGGAWKCGTNGSFSGTKCSAKSCTAAAVANSNKSSGGSITGTTGSTTAVQCDAGYTGGGTWTCGTNGSFSGTKCSVGGCTATEVPNSDKSDTGSITGNTGSTTAVQCDTGYTGGGAWTCRTNGKFSGTACSAKSCTATEVPNSDKAGAGSITGATGSTTAVQCNTGYTGGGVWTCGANGEFAGTKCTLPGCTATQVPNSDKSSDGSITGVNGSTTAVTCNTGYTGGGNWLCGSNGSFSGTGCNPKSCTATEVPNSNKAGAGSITGQTGSTTTVTCGDGYDGGGTWTCGADGKFSGIPCYKCGPDETALEDCKFKIMTPGNEATACDGDTNCFYDKITSCQPDFTKRIACNSRTQGACGTNDACQWDANYKICKPNDTTIQACAAKDSSACTSSADCQWMGTCHTKPSSSRLTGWTGTKGVNCDDNMNSILNNTAPASAGAKTGMEQKRIIYCNDKGLPKPGNDVECMCEDSYSGTNCEIPPSAVSTCPTHLTQGNPDSCYTADGKPRKDMDGCCWAPDGAQIKGSDGSLASFTWFKQDLNRVDGQNNCGCDCTKAVTSIRKDEKNPSIKHEIIADFTDESLQYHNKDENLTYTDANGNKVAYGKSCVANCTDSSPTDCIDANGNKLVGAALAQCPNVNTPCHDRGTCNAQTNKCEATNGYPSYCNIDIANGSNYLGDYCQDDGNPNAGDVSRFDTFCGIEDAQNNKSGYAIKNTSGDGKPFKCSCYGDWGHSGQDAFQLGWGTATQTGDERGIFACDVAPCEANTWKTLQSSLDNLMPLEVDSYEYISEERPVYITKGMTVHWPDAYKADSTPPFANRLKMNPDIVLNSAGNFDFTQNKIVVESIAPRNSKAVLASWAADGSFVQDNSDRSSGAVMKKTIFEMEGAHDANTSSYDRVYLGLEDSTGTVTRISYHQLPAGAQVRFSWPYTGAHNSITCGHFDYSSGSLVDAACITDNNGNSRACPCKPGVVKNSDGVCAASKCPFGWFGPKCQYPMDGSKGPNLCDWTTLDAVVNPTAQKSDQFKWVHTLNGYPMSDKSGRPSRLAGKCKTANGQPLTEYKTESQCVAATLLPIGDPALNADAVWVPNAGTYEITSADLLPNASSNQTCTVVSRDGRGITEGNPASPLDISYEGKGESLAQKWQKGMATQKADTGTTQLVGLTSAATGEFELDTAGGTHLKYCYTENGSVVERNEDGGPQLDRFGGVPEACRIMPTDRTPCGEMDSSGDPKTAATQIWKEGVSGRNRADLCGTSADSTCAVGPQLYGTATTGGGVDCSACTRSVTSSITGEQMGGGDDKDWKEFARDAGGGDVPALDLTRKCTQLADGPIVYWKVCDCARSDDFCAPGDTSRNNGGCAPWWNRSTCIRSGSDSACGGGRNMDHSGSSATEP